MHTYEHEGTRFHHHGDFSGEAYIYFPGQEEVLVPVRLLVAIAKGARPSEAKPEDYFKFDGKGGSRRVKSPGTLKFRFWVDKPKGPVAGGLRPGELMVLVASKNEGEEMVSITRTKASKHDGNGDGTVTIRLKDLMAFAHYALEHEVRKKLDSLEPGQVSKLEAVLAILEAQGGRRGRPLR